VGRETNTSTGVFGGCSRCGGLREFGRLSEFRVKGYGFGFEVEGLGLRVQDVGFRV
jgi:hypothetical protein